MEVSEIGFGCWGIGGAVKDAIAYGPTSDAQSRQALRKAYDAGITFYDTSDFYGYGHSEKLIADALKGVRKDIVIATKGGLLDASGGGDFSPAYIRRALEASLERLQTDYVDLYQLHSPSLDVLRQTDDLIALLDALRCEGKIRAVGISVRSPEDGLVAVNEFSFKCVQVNFNLLDRRLVESGLLDLCAQRKVGVIVRTPLCFGFLTGAYSEDSQFPATDHRHKWPREQVKRWSRAYLLFAAALAKPDTQSHTQTALRFCLSFPQVSCTIPGMLSEAEVDDNIAASGLGGFSQEELDALDKVYRDNVFFAPAAKRAV